MNCTSPDIVGMRTFSLLEHPYQRYCGVRLKSQSPGHAQCELTATDRISNLGGNLHGGVIYSVADLTCMLAVLPMLSDHEYAVSIDASFSLIAAIPLGSELSFDGKVIRKGKKLVFSSCEVRRGTKTVALAKITKSVLQNECFATLGDPILQRNP